MILWGGMLGFRARIWKPLISLMLPYSTKPPGFFPHPSIALSTAYYSKPTQRQQSTSTTTTKLPLNTASSYNQPYTTHQQFRRYPQSSSTTAAEYSHQQILDRYVNGFIETNKFLLSFKFMHLAIIHKQIRPNHIISSRKLWPRCNNDEWTLFNQWGKPSKRLFKFSFFIGNIALLTGLYFWVNLSLNNRSRQMCLLHRRMFMEIVIWINLMECRNKLKIRIQQDMALMDALIHILRKLVFLQAITHWDSKFSYFSFE